MIVYQGPSFRIDLINPAAQKIFGHRMVEGKTVREAFPEAQATRWFDLLSRVYASGESIQEIEMPIMVDSANAGIFKESFWNVTLQPLNDPGEPTNDILLHAVEVTEQVRARQ